MREPLSPESCSTQVCQKRLIPQLPPCSVDNSYSLCPGGLCPAAYNGRLQYIQYIYNQLVVIPYMHLAYYFTYHYYLDISLTLWPNLTRYTNLIPFIAAPTIEKT